MARRAIAVMVVLALAPALAEAQPVVRLAGDGRTLFVPSNFDQRQPVRFEVDAVPGVPDCLSKRPEAGPLEIRYRFVVEPEQPDVLPTNSESAPLNEGIYSVPASTTGAHFLTFNLWERSTPVTTEAERARLEQCVTRRRTLEVAITKLRNEIGAATTVVKGKTSAVETLTARMQDLAAQIAAYQHIVGDGVAQVARLQREREGVRAALLTAQQELEAANDGLAKSTGDLESLEADLGDTADAFVTATDRLSKFLGASKGAPAYYEAVVLRIGGILAHKDDKAVYYDLWKRKPSDVISIIAMGTPPVVRYGDRQFAVLTNVTLDAFDRPFAIRVTAQAGSVINTTPVRPVFDLNAVRTAAEAALLPSPTVTPAAIVYRDVFLPVSGNFAPNDHPVVTIVTERRNAEGKPEEVKLVDGAKFPQFRAQYRYNFTTGVMRSGLKDPSFTKVKTADDDPATEKDNEARYRVATDSGHVQIVPMFAFTFYPYPVDPQGPVTHERWIPAPTIGFAFTNPGREVFVGFSHEIIRNTQFFWGWHFGEVTERVDRNDVSEDHDSSAPSTQKGRGKAFAFGLSFNINIVKQIFK